MSLQVQVSGQRDNDVQDQRIKSTNYNNRYEHLYNQGTINSICAIMMCHTMSNV